MMQRAALQGYLDQLLDPTRMKDYCPNGLQVEGRESIQRVLCGVTANLALVEEAIRWQADAIFVHHGWFWRGEDGRVTGFRRERMAKLLANDINLFAYHLPLDVHPVLGNNAQLAQRLAWRETGRCGEQGLLCLGEPMEANTVGSLQMHIAGVLGRQPQVVGELSQPVRRVAWCTGGAQNSFEQAIAAGVDAYVTGEISEPVVHLARECGVAFIAAGHHATERYGALAVSEHLAAVQGFDTRFVDIDSPV